VRRRKFIALLGSAAVALPMVARGQQDRGMRRIGVFMNGSEADPTSRTYFTAFRQALRPLGWIEGRQVQFDVRWAAGDPARISKYAQELARLKPDVILSASSPNLAALQKTNSPAPIVFTLVSDPVVQGFVSNLSHPEGNITGFANYEASMGGKWVDLLKQISPRLARVGFIYNPDVSIQSKVFLRAIEAAAPSFGVAVTAVAVHSTAEIEQAIASIASQPNAGLIVPTDGFLVYHRRLIVDLVAQNRLPTIYPIRPFVSAGGLMFYGTSLVDQFRQAAVYVDRVLKGVKPADLPIQLPTKFELVINVRTARALGIDLPMGLMLRADEVIE
jgi:putative ABC transport system substrate-binding protein